MPGRSIYNEPIRYGYHGMEMDPEQKDDGNHYTTYFRQYDPRLGRWMSLDPASAMFPFESNYAANHNNPIMFIDSEGDSPILAGFLIAIGTDFVMQFTKGLVANWGSKGFIGAVSYSFQNIDLADVIISGLVGMALPGLGIYRKGLDLATKQLRKRIVKYTGKVLMNMFDVKFVKDKVRKGDEEAWRLTFSFTAFNFGVGTNLGKDVKSREDRWRDRVFTLFGIAIQEFDFALEWISLGFGQFTNNGNINPNSSFSTIAYGKGDGFSTSIGSGADWVYGFRLSNQLSMWLAQQFYEGLIKGVYYNEIKNWSKTNFPSSKEGSTKPPGIVRKQLPGTSSGMGGVHREELEQEMFEIDLETEVESKIEENNVNKE